MARRRALHHRRNQHETRRIGDAVIGARDRNLAALQRLAQRVEHLRLEFRNYVAVSPGGLLGLIPTIPLHKPWKSVSAPSYCLT